jgi:hypothetical protein
MKSGAVKVVVTTVATTAAMTSAIKNYKGFLFGGLRPYEKVGSFIPLHFISLGTMLLRFSVSVSSLILGLGNILKEV